MANITEQLEWLAARVPEALRTRTLERISLNQDYREVFSTPAGRRVLANIAKNGNVHKPIFSREPHTVIWNEAQRHFATSILKFAGTGEEEIINQVMKGKQHDDYSIL